MFEKLDSINQKFDRSITATMDQIGNHPWESWISVANRCIAKCLPLAIAVIGLLSFFTGLIIAIKYDARMSQVLIVFGILLWTVFSMHLAPKALSLLQSMVDRGAMDVIRPELAHILKVAFGLGGLALAIAGFFSGTGEGAVFGLVALVGAVICVIVFSRPDLIGVKYDYPKNCLEEAIGLVLLPLKVLCSLIALVVAVAMIACLVMGIVAWFDKYGDPTSTLLVGAVVPMMLPLIVYSAYLSVFAVCDLFRAVCSVPQKLDDVRKAIESK